MVWKPGTAEVRRRGRDVALLAVGRMAEVARRAADLLAADGVSCSVVNARWVKPVDTETLGWAASNHRLVVTIEENTGIGGFGASVCEVYADLGISSPVLRLAIPDCFVTHGATSQLLSDIGLTPDGVRGAVLGRLLDLDPEAGPSEWRLLRRGPMARRRIDAVLVDRGLFPSRERARAAVLAGEVRVAGQVVHKAGRAGSRRRRDRSRREAPLRLSRRRQARRRVRAFRRRRHRSRAVDVGASTGGFTDCLLQSGASEVAAVDVGYGQLAWQLRGDERVRVFERTNIRHADVRDLGGPFELVVVDVSFITLQTVMPALIGLMGDPPTGRAG